jgi:hypothetical protein
MHEGFEGWVRVLCAGPLAYAALVAYAIPYIPLAAVCGGLAIIFAIWPERLAYGYRKNRFVPFWSKPVSIVGRDSVVIEPPAETFATYRPRLLNLFSAYFSIVWYVVFGFDLWRVQPMHVPFLIIVGTSVLLWLVSRSEA